MTDEFTPILVSVKELFRGDKIDTDKRNYYIPLYQRKYAWNTDHVEKLIRDIKEVSDLKDGNEFQPYFIGGIVLSSESIEGEDRTKKSLEVIDGQQRLTTIALLLAVINQQIKSDQKNYTYNKDFMDDISEEIVNLLHSKELDYETRQYENKVKVERADDLKGMYNDILSDFCKIPSINIEEYFEEKDCTDEDAQNLRDVVIQINIILNEFTEDELIDFISQLLRFTKLVVTLTVNIDTGFLVFEKLNDSGIDLEPQDLLKNYLFRTSNKSEYDDLTLQWKSFLEDVKKINTTKSKILPREFLESYLQCIGLKVDPKKNKRAQVFKLFKNLRKDNFSESLDLLLDLKNTAREYKALKQDPIISYYLNKMSFKLGYLIFLSFYKKYPQEYKIKKIEILAVILRIGLSYLLTSNSKKLSEVVPVICTRIYTSQLNIIENINDFSNYTEGLLESLEKDFITIVSSTNLFRKKSLTSILLNILNFNMDGNKLGKDITLEQVVSQNIDLEKNKLENLNNENIKVYANLIGNLTILPYELDKSINSFSLEDKILHIKELTPIAINNFSEIAYIDKNIQDEYSIISIDKVKKWSKEVIEQRSRIMTNIITNIIFKSGIPIDFLKLNNVKYFIKRNENKHAVMVVQEDGYKVLSKSRCNKEHHDSWAYGELKEELINNSILIDKGEYLEFSQDYIFNSPSAASSIVLGKQSPGPLDWRDINGVSYRDK